MTDVISTRASGQRLVTSLPGPVSLALTARQRGAVAAGISTMLGVWIEDGEGALLRDVDGNTLIDLGSGIAVTGVGHAHPRVVRALESQAAAFSHTCFMVSPYEQYLSVCEALNQMTPGGHDKRSVLLSSGAEAVENAVKIARTATARDAVVVFDHGYHGRTNLTMAMTSKVMPYKRGFGPFAGEVYRAPMSYPFRDPEGLTGEQAAARATEMIDKQVGSDQVAAVVIEPIQGEGGFVVPAPGFLPALAAWCTAHGALLVADEIQTGFARTGTMFACDHEGVVPDLVTTAKGIAAGMPLAAVTGRAELMDSVHPGGLGGTYGGNPLACAAALAAFTVYAEEDLAGRARHIESVVKPVLRDAGSRHPGIGEVRGRGAMLALELVAPGGTEPDPAAAAAISRRCHDAGVLTLTCGTYGNVIRLLPAMVITDEQLDAGLSVLVESIDAVLG